VELAAAAAAAAMHLRVDAERREYDLSTHVLTVAAAV